MKTFCLPLKACNGLTTSSEVMILGQAACNHILLSTHGFDVARENFEPTLLSTNPAQAVLSCCCLCAGTCLAMLWVRLGQHTYLLIQELGQGVTAA